MKEFKYTSIFSSVVKPLVSEDKDFNLALASLAQVGNFIPQIDTEKEVDLLPIAFNACVVNRVNKNGDVIDASTAVEVYKSFINKQINIEHNRERVVGVILTAGFSEFGTDVPLTEDDVRFKKEPFNITLGGVVWKVVNPHLCNLIEDSADPSSENHLKISASWELGFSEYNLLAIAGDEKNIAEAEIISDFEQVEELKTHLRALGGDGKLKDGRKVYRQVIDKVVPLGIGLTENPAADVKGVSVTANTQEIKEEERIAASENIISQPENNDVNEFIRTMKLNSVKDITEDSLKELSASAISDLVEKELKEASEKFSAEKLETENALKAAHEKNDNLQKEHEAVREELATLKAELEKLVQEKASKEAQETFSQRMASFDEEYELDDADREVLAAEIKSLDEETFAAFKKKMAVLMKDKSKAAKKKAYAEVEAKNNLVEKVEEVKASEIESTTQIVENAIEKAEVQKETVPLSTAASEETLFNRYKKAFELGQFEIKL